MPITVTPTSIPDVLVIEPKVFGDDRGFFFESFNQQEFDEAIGQEIEFVQDNHSKSKKGVLRGLHYQLEHAQGKLVRVIRGAVYDVVIDLRQSSNTYGRWVGIELSEVNKKQLWVPVGFAHGFLTISAEAEFLYKTTEYYRPDFEYCLSWSDKSIAIEWPIIDVNLELSEKDKQGLSWEETPKFK